MVESTTELQLLDDEPPGGRSHAGCARCGAGTVVEGLSECGNGLETVYPTTAVRFGYMRYIGEFSHLPDVRFTCGAQVVIQTQRGIELGEQVSLTCSGCDRSVTRDQMREWVERSGKDTYVFNAGRILREATAADLAEFARIQSGCRTKRDFARELAERHGLPLRVIECECPLGGERIIFYFSAAERVDFRAMVKDLAREYRTRIEMRQIGARDEARLLADYETCGRQVCCKVYLKTLRPISMRMAKLQKATLDPSQVSGRCGRLKCCLRYEHTAYEELDKRLPRVGVRIRTSHGEGVVINRQILTQLVQIRMDDDTLATVVVEDILSASMKPPRDGAPPPEQVEAKTLPQKRPTPEPDSPEAGPKASQRAQRASASGAPRRSERRPRAPRSPKTPAGAKQQGRTSASRRKKPRRRRRRRDGGSGDTLRGEPPPPGR